MIECRNCKAWLGTPSQRDEAVRELLSSRRWGRATEVSEELFSKAAQDGPAEGDYSCLNCGAVNQVARLIGGNWDVLLIELPTQPDFQRDEVVS